MRNCSETSDSAKTHRSKRVAKDNNHNKDDKDIDFFGIFDVSNKEVSGLHDKSGQTESTLDKYKDLLNSRQSMLNEQNYLTTTFGRVRLDSDNEVKSHGQYDPENPQPKFDIKEFEEKLKTSRRADDNQDFNQNENNGNIFEDQYFSQLKDLEEKRIDIPREEERSTSSPTEKSSELGFIDRNFFPDIEPLIKSKINFKFSHKFSQYLEEKASELSSHEMFSRRSGRNMNRRAKETIESKAAEDNYIPKAIDFMSPLKPELFTENFNLKVEPNLKSDENLEEIIEKKIEEQMDIKLEDIPTSADRYKRIPRTGAQYLEDLQSGKESPQYPKIFTEEVKQFGKGFNLKREKLDSKGYRILSGQVLDYKKMTREDILQVLIDSVLFDDCDIVAINKPYGMSMHSRDSKTSPVLTDYLPQLSKSVETEELYTVHRLDRDTTGVLLLAKTQEKAKQLNRMFVEHSIIKRYVCITRGVPEQPEGIIDIPIEIGNCEGKERMVLRPEALEEYKKITKPSKSAKRAVTQYKVICEHKNAALVEVKQLLAHCLAQLICEYLHKK